MRYKDGIKEEDYEIKQLRLYNTRGQCRQRSVEEGQVHHIHFTTWFKQGRMDWPLFLDLHKKNIMWVTAYLCCQRVRIAYLRTPWGTHQQKMRIIHTTFIFEVLNNRL